MSEAYPGPTDVRLWFYPEAAAIYVSLMDEANPAVRAFEIRDGNVKEISITPFPTEVRRPRR
jgi:hypothetical protein